MGRALEEEGGRGRKDMAGGFEGGRGRMCVVEARGFEAARWLVLVGEEIDPSGRYGSNVSGMVLREDKLHA